MTGVAKDRDSDSRTRSRHCPYQHPAACRRSHRRDHHGPRWRRDGLGAIGGSDTHLQVLEAPQRISKLVLDKGLDSSFTSIYYPALSIVEITLGENIGAKLRAAKAESDKQIAQAEAEKRRAMAVAAEQENVAQIKLMEAKLVEAQAQIPQAIAAAFRERTTRCL